MIKFYNTLSRHLDDFHSLEDKKVRLYVCGLTVYSEPHIGNWSAYVEWDILVRMLRGSGYQVNHVQNITDVGHLTDDEDAGEDKLAKAAAKQRVTAWQIAEKYIKSAEAGRRLLNITEPSHSPKATEYISQQVDFVKQLEAKGYTYEINGDGIYFDTSKLDNYGQLARLDVSGLKAGARIENKAKKNSTDFALWKFSKTDEKRDMEWDSPWGVGFPGWHLECSVMATELLGEQIDIHTGGIDHINVHHTNEIAQSESVSGKRFANYWLHANHIKVDGHKMSKSLGNIYTLKNITDRGYNPIAFRLLTLESHYRTESNFTWKLLDGAASRLQRWQQIAEQRWQPHQQDSAEKYDFSGITNEALGALQDDLDTPAALRALEKIFSHIESQGINEKEVAAFNKSLEFISDFLGINLVGPDIDSKTKDLILRRRSARENNDFELADKLRDQLKQKGVSVDDTTWGPRWHRL